MNSPKKNNNKKNQFLLKKISSKNVFYVSILFSTTNPRP